MEGICTWISRTWSVINKVFSAFLFFFAQLRHESRRSASIFYNINRPLRRMNFCFPFNAIWTITICSRFSMSMPESNACCCWALLAQLRRREKQTPKLFLSSEKFIHIHCSSVSTITSCREIYTDRSVDGNDFKYSTALAISIGTGGGVGRWSPTTRYPFSSAVYWML